MIRVGPGQWSMLVNFTLTLYLPIILTNTNAKMQISNGCFTTLITSAFYQFDGCIMKRLGQGLQKAGKGSGSEKEATGGTCCNYTNKLWSNFRIMFLSVRFWRLIYNIKKILRIWTNLCGQGTQESKYLMIFGPSGAPALKTDMTLLWKSLQEPRNSSRNHCLWTQLTVPSTNTGKVSNYQAKTKLYVKIIQKYPVLSGLKKMD